MGWFKKHKIITVILAVIVIAVIASAASGGGNTNNNSADSGSSSNAEKTYKFNDRADKQPKDVEVLPGETATVGGVKMTLSGVEYKTRLNDFETAGSGKTYVVADVALENTSNETQPYNVFDFRIQTAGGQVLDGAISTIQTLSSGDLVAGGKVTGKIVFEVPVEDGHQYVVWKPNAFNADRAIIQIK
ncbi:MAG: DUF4352 domain-containing protein [Candidatus Saccharimonadales bacterium]